MKGIWKYSHLLPPVTESSRLTLGEGNTFLVRSKYIGPALDFSSLYFKLEITNPSGSYKDRYAANAVSRLMESRIPLCLATSSGNTGAALAAYSAAAGIRCVLLIVDGAPAGKLQQMQAYGADIAIVKNFGIDAAVTAKVMELLKTTARALGSEVHISAYRHSPLGMTGVQTIAYEIAEDLPQALPAVFVPAGGGGLTLAIAKGFAAWKNTYPSYPGAQVHCVQPEGNDTISGPLGKGLAQAVPVSQSTTSISGLQVPNVIDGDEAIAACRISGGTGHTVTDDEVYRCQHELAVKEGIYCEPAGAVALAGLVKAREEGRIDREQPAVCLITGHGFKDPVSAARMTGKTLPGYLESLAETRDFLTQQISNNKLRS